MNRPGAWLLPDLMPTEGVLTALAAEFELDIAPEYGAMVVYADSFDWRIYQRGCLLHCHGSCWTLYHADSGETTVQRNGPELQTSCSALDFPPGGMRALLEPILGIRCLLPLATARLRRRPIGLLNRDNKTVARIVIETQRTTATDGERRHCLFRLHGIRGYESEQAGARRILAEAGVTQAVSPLIGVEEACLANGRKPLDYSPKFLLELGDGETAHEAMTRIYQTLLDAITRNIPGVLADHDTEFLHDLRVAIRRTRSGLSLVKRVLPASISERFNRMFRRLGALTGPTRDLDVYLLAYEGYLKRVPPVLRPGLEEFFATLRHKRQIEQKRLVRALRTKKNEALFNAWRRAFRRPYRQQADLTDLPVRELADRVILKRYKLVMRAGRGLNAATADTEVHRLRIQCKKLRFVVEFFGSLYPKQELEILIRQLKKLQDILGGFNDLSVQQGMISQSLSSLSAGLRGNFDQAAALGGLLQSLFQEQQGLRGNFAEAFAEFGDQKTAALFHELFRKRRDLV
ncbi:MAG: CHAD domain-containing protein [Candidatus Adiutrix sp.]|jgi:CHAD domain-containing protein|nr:CHAD domain-containing protein [Candidatus Adiutrix sp.]